MPRPQNEKENLQFIQELAEVDGPFESPININFLDLTKLELPPLCWNRSDAVPKKMKLTNSGHTVILSGRWNRERPYLTGGPLEGNYVFSQVHFHWGPDNCRGSEHTVCGEKFPLEMHVAHFKTEYSTQECALQEKDGMVVVVYLFKLQDEPNASLKRLISALPCIQEANTSVAIDPKPLIALCNTFTEDYFTYWGSVVTSTCAHILMWIISREPFGISRDQMDEFRKIMDCTQRPILRNNRDTQPLHGRNVFHVNPSRFLDKPLLPIKKIMGCFCSDVTEQKETGDSKRRSSSRGCCCSNNNNNNDGSNHKESTDSKDIKDSHHSSNHDHNSTNINNNNKPQRSQEEIEGKDVKSTRFSDQTSGVNNKQMVYVQHATIHSNPVFKKQLYNGDCDAIPEEKREDSDLKEKDEVSHSCCFLPVKKEPKDYEKESRKEKADKNRDNKKSFDSVKALSNIINSLEALKDHTYKKLQELECISMEIKELKTYCVEPSEQRWLRKIEKIITRQKRYTLRTSRCCFSELKKLAKEYNIDKVLDRKMILSTEDGKNFPTEENDFQEEEKSEQIDNQSPLPNYSTCKQEKFSKKAQKLIKSFFEDIQESEKTQKTVQKDLEVRRASKWKLDDEMKTQASSAAGSKVYITQTMFKLGDFGNRFFTEITPEKNKEVVAKKDNKKENNGMPCKKEKRSKIIPLHRTDVVFRFKNKPKLKKCSSSSSALISSESEIRMVKKKKSKKSGKKKTKNAIEPVKKKNAKTQYVSLSSEETTEAEMQIPVVSKRKSRKDIWENQSVISLEPDVSSSEKKKNICEKRPKGKLNNVKQEMSKRSMKMVLEQNEILREKNLLKTEREFEKSPKSPERKKLKLIQKENNMKPLIVCKAEDLNLVEKSVMTDDNQIHTPKEMGDSLRATDVLIQTENESGKSKEMSTADEVSKKSWPTPLPRSRDSSSDKKQIMPFPRFYDNCMQRRATSPVIIYHSANKQNVEGSKSYRYEIHNHENPAQTFLENSTVESERPIIEKNNFLGKELKDQEVHRETDSNDSNYEKISKAAKSDVTILSLRSSENEEIRKDGKNRTMSAESFSTSKTIYQKKRRQRQSRKTHKTPSTVKILDTIESSRLEFSNLTEDEQLQIISANVASFVKQKLLEHKRNMESKETSGPISLGEVEQALLKELKTKIAGPKIEENVPDVPHELENRWSTAVLNVPSEKNIQTAEPKEQVKIEPAPALKPEKIEPVASKPVHNFIKKNKLLAGKYKRKIPAKKADGPKKMIKPPKTISTEPTSSDSKSPVRVLRPHVCNPVVIAPQEKRRDRSASVQKPTSNPVKSPSTPKESNSKRPASSKDFPKQQPTVPPVVKKIPKPSKRWIPTYTLTSYLQTPLEVAGSQRMKFLCDKEDKVENLDLNTSDLEYLIKLEMCINNEIAANMENSMNYVKTLLSQDYNGSAIIEKPPIKDSFNIFDPINNNNNGILLIELHDSGNNVTDYETSESRNYSKKISKLRRKRRRIKKKWSDLNRLQESGDKTVYDSDYNSNSSDLDTKRSEKSETDNKDVSDILKTYIYHLGRGEESNINLTEKCDPPTEEETVIISKPQIKKRNEKPLLSSEMKEKLLEVLTEEMKQEIENQEKFMTASSQDCSSVATEETMTSCERTEMWTKMLKEFLEENNKDVSNKDPDNDESDVKKSEDNISRSYDD